MQVIQNSNTDLGFVKVCREDLVMPKGISAKVKGVAHTGIVDDSIQAIVEPCVEQTWPDGLFVNETVVTLRRWSVSRIRL